MTNEAEADEKAGDLKKALENKPRIRELAKNPLLLAIIGIIHRYEAQLPEDRLVLYDKATEALLYTWDNVKEIIDEKFKPEDKRRFLEKTAFHLQSVEKGDEAGTVISRDELYEILFPDFREIFCCDNRKAKALVNEFLETIRLRAGLLVESAPGLYGFAHKTFQEYFAAQWIANEAMLNFDLDIMIQHIDTFIDNAFWQETLLLELRALPNKQARKVLEHILNRDPKGIEAHFYHNHYFVLKFIAEQGRWLNDRDFVQNRIDDFFDFSWNDGKERSYFDNKTWRRFQDWAAAVSDSLARSILSEKLLPLAEDKKQSGSLRCDCAQELGNLGYKEKAIIERLLTMAEEKKQDGYLRRYCAQALGNLGYKEKAASILLNMAEDEKQHGLLRSYCAQAVGNLGYKEKAAEILLSMAQDEKQHGYLRRDCAQALGELGYKEKAAEVLLSLAQDEKQKGYIRSYCAQAVGNLGYKEKAIIEGLVTLAQDEKQHGYLRSSCAQAVGNLGYKEKAASILLTITEDEKQDGDIRRYCAEALGELGYKEKAASILLTMAQDEKQDGYLRRDCAQAVGNLGYKEKAAEMLLTLAQDEKQHGYIRRSCAQALGNLGYKEKAARILISLYLEQTDKYSDDALMIYGSLWEVTEV
jgi:HEAT repeat protein